MQDHIFFTRGNLTVKETAQALGLDVQTVRVLLRTGAVSWGQAIKKPGSSHFSYLISPKKFFEETGVLLGADITDDLAERILRSKIRELDQKIAESPDFLVEELRAERRMYEKHLEQLGESSDEWVGRI